MDGVIHLTKRFPDRGQAIREFALADEAFRSICSDFAVAKEVLDRYSSRTFDDFENRHREYEAPVVELIAELSEALDACWADRSKSPGNSQTER